MHKWWPRSCTVLRFHNWPWCYNCIHTAPDAKRIPTHLQQKRTRVFVEASKKLSSTFTVKTKKGALIRTNSQWKNVSWLCNGIWVRPIRALHTQWWLFQSPFDRPFGTNTRLCVIAGDISPIDVITHVPIICEDKDVPYIYVNSKVGFLLPPWVCPKSEHICMRNAQFEKQIVCSSILVQPVKPRGQRLWCLCPIKRVGSLKKSWTV